MKKQEIYQPEVKILIKGKESHDFWNNSTDEVTSGYIFEIEINILGIISGKIGENFGVSDGVFIASDVLSGKIKVDKIWTCAMEESISGELKDKIIDLARKYLNEKKA
jgi:hypothetical protein